MLAVSFPVEYVEHVSLSYLLGPHAHKHLPFGLIFPFVSLWKVRKFEQWLVLSFLRYANDRAVLFPSWLSLTRRKVTEPLLEEVFMPSGKL